MTACAEDLMSDGQDMLMEIQERRLQAVERASVEFLSHVKAEEFRLQSISEKIDDLKGDLTESVNRLSESVDAINKQNASHHNCLKQLMEEKKQGDIRKAKIKKVAYGAAIAAVAAFATQFGTAAWAWAQQILN